MKKLFFLIILLAAVPRLSADEKVTFTASAPDAVVVGDKFKLEFVVNTHNVRDFRAPAMNNFEVLMGPVRASLSNTREINGVRSVNQTIKYTYTLLATTEGEFTIPVASIQANGNEVLSNSVKIKVLPEGQQAARSNGNSGGQQGTSAGSAPHHSVSNEDLFVTVNAGKTKLYEQEAFLLTYKIYTAVDLRGLEDVKLPDFTGFHSQEIEQTNARWELEHYRGRNYRTTVYRQFVLFPQQPGQLVIEPARFDMVIAQALQHIDPFEAFFNGGQSIKQIKKSVHTPRITLEVESLPSGKPIGFSGGVGDFTISSSINTTELKTNDALTLKVVISGTGNLRLVRNPEVKFPDDFEIYDPKVENNFRVTRDGQTGNKVIEYLAIPRHAGNYKIPALEFSYFDLKSKTYKTLTTEEYQIRVEKGDGNAEQVIANFTNKEDLRVLGEDIRYIKFNEVKLRPKGEFFFGSTGYLLFYIIPAIAFILFFIVYRKQAMENANVSRMRTKRANKAAVKRLKLAGKLMNENKKDAFYDEVLKALWGYISDKLNIPVSQLSKDNIEEKLSAYGVEEALIREFLNALHECEFARFAPGDESTAMDHVYHTSLEVISKMENSIKH
ncbi:MAG: BatD family protein [Bacteroides sp.]|nr:BatD family protein [Bacteroides sp.]